MAMLKRLGQDGLRARPASRRHRGHDAAGAPRVTTLGAAVAALAAGADEV
jgi:hypothetical protein